MMVVRCSFSQKLLHSQFTRKTLPKVTDYNQVLTNLYSKAVLCEGKKMESGKSMNVVLGNRIKYNLVHSKFRFGKCIIQNAFLRTGMANHGKRDLDFSRVPILKEDDLEEAFVKGSGPGGQAVNKTNNCVVLTHKPTGIVVKCHESRLQEKNRQLAREMLCTKLDNYLNGGLSIEAQKKDLQRKKSIERASRQKKLAAMKEKWRKENFADGNS